jgi:hypothetical protein
MVGAQGIGDIMPIDFTIDLGALRDIVDAAEANAKVALTQGLVTMADAARNLAPVGETGHLKQSIRRGAIEGSLSAGTLHGDLSATAPGAEAQEFGSGKYGPRAAAYEIRPRFKKALRFHSAGSVAGGDVGFRFAKAVIHPGVKAKRFLQQGVEQGVDNLAAEIAAAIAMGKR